MIYKDEYQTINYCTEYHNNRSQWSNNISEFIEKVTYNKKIRQEQVKICTCLFDLLKHLSLHHPMLFELRQLYKLDAAGL